MVTTDAVVGGFPVLMWVLWGGLALFFCGLYAGVYIWMRRPRFGEGEGGTRRPRHRATPAGTTRAPGSQSCRP